MDKAVIICEHLLDDPSCVKHAFRTEPTESSDSGWQVLCEKTAHSEDEAKVVSEEEIKQMIPSIVSILGAQAPCMFTYECNKWVRH